MAKTKEKAKELSQLIKDRDLHKTYLARVTGRFPEHIINHVVRVRVSSFTARQESFSQLSNSHVYGCRASISSAESCIRRCRW